MAITRKPNPPTVGKDVDIEALINKGGSAAAERKKKQQPTKEVPVIVRIPSDLLDRIDGLVAERQLKTPRHTWLLEAFLEKANREEGNL
jgi:hypothetical protein